MIKLAVFDLDGTLADLGKGIPEANVRLLKKLEAMGVRIAISSGKPTEYLCGMLRQIGLQDPIMIGENGAAIRMGVDLPPREFYILPYSEDAARTIEFLKKKFKELIPGMWYQNNEVGLTPFPKIEEEFEMIEQCLRENAEHIKDVIIYRQCDCFDITPVGITKYDGLAFLAKLLGVSPDEVAAVGDGINDYPMFEYAGFSIGIRAAQPDRVSVNVQRAEDALLLLIKRVTEGI